MRATERDKVDAGASMLGRITAILSCFTLESPVLSISELSRRTGLAKSSVSRIARDLEAYQYLERSGSGVRLGLRLFEFGETAARPRDLRKVALATMADLRNSVNRTVHLAVLERFEVVYIEILPARGTPGLPSRVGGRMPAHATGVGKALLAYLPEDSVTEYIDHGLRQVGPRTLTDADHLRQELSGIRANGVAYERHESGEGIACAGAPVFGADGTPVAAISAAGWVEDFDEQRVGLAVRTAASVISREVGRRTGLRV